MSTRKNSALIAVLFISLFIVATVLCVFSSSIASEFEELPTQEAVSDEATVDVPKDEAISSSATIVEAETAEETPVTNPDPWPLDVYRSDGQPATEAEDFEWDVFDRIFTIKVSGLTFVGDGGVKDCCILTEEGKRIDSVTLNNVNISYSGMYDTLLLNSTSDLELNIIGSCSITSTMHSGVHAISDNGGTLTIKGDSTSSLDINCDSVTIYDKGYTTMIFTGGISLNASSDTWNALDVETESLVFDTTGKVYVRAINTVNNASAILGRSPSFCIYVNKGIVELHGNDINRGGSAIYSNNKNAASAIQLASNYVMYGAESSTATLAECRAGAYMLASSYASISYIDGGPAGTVIICEGTPGGGGEPETYVSAQTGDSIPGVVIALIALAALSSIVARGIINYFRR